MRRAIIAGNLKKVATMSGGVVRITFDSQDVTFGAASMEDVSLLTGMAMTETFGQFIFVEGELPDNSVDAPPPPSPPEKEKSWSLRQRNHLYRLWEKLGGEGEFEDYYAESMERNLDYLTRKINEK
jgi:hypothetical protein